ncbi:hypothetical protein HDU76_009908 [Blyttiomyces sp. JEL0837]|nr:hypothetical protein HDU76_009908 [Blyttiomyces sp. JEL0837]
MDKSRISRLAFPPVSSNGDSSGDLKLYEWFPEFNTKLVAALPESTPIKCFDWSSEPNVFAVGYTTGRTSILRYTTGSTEDMSRGIESMHEFMPRHMRACNAVAFCPQYPQLLLAGLDKVRNDYCLLIWNVETSGAPLSANANGKLNGNDLAPSAMGSTTSMVSQPQYQFGTSEAVSSASWFSQENQSLVAGMGQKWIRVFDLRKDTTSHSIVIATKSVQGLTTNPFDSRSFASYSDNVVAVWDTRKTAEPILSFDGNFKSGVGHLAWSPVRSGRLAAVGVGKDAMHVNVWDIQEGVSVAEVNSGLDSNVSVGGRESTVGTSEAPYGDETGGEFYASLPIVRKVRKVVPSSTPVLGFAWIPLDSNVFCDWIVTCHAKDKFELSKLPEHSRLTWNPAGALVQTAGKILTGLGDVEVAEDVLKLMHDRAKNGYALNPKRNCQIVADNPSLKEAWSWISEMREKSLQKKTTLGDKDFAFNGVISVIDTMTRNGVSSTTTAISSSPSSTTPFVSYSNEYRKLAGHLCGWDHEGEELAPLSLEKDEYPEKAAGLAFFRTSSFHRAVHALSSSQDEKLKLIAAALSGYMSGAPGSMWLSLCRSLSQELENPYLRSMFTLISTGGDWMSVVQTKGLPLKDRIGVALRYLSDNELKDFLEACKTDYVTRGDLEGLFLTGLSPDGTDMIATYVDRTGDVQSASLIMCSSIVQKKDGRIEEWIESRSLKELARMGEDDFQPRDQRKVVLIVANPCRDVRFV